MNVDTLIVGAGFSGLCMAIKLKEAGMGSFLVIEKSDGIGGTWWENRYPGCACDIPSHLYSFSFDLNPKWSRMFAGWEEIQEYLDACVDRRGIRDKIRFKTELKEATWDEEAGMWRVTTAGGTIIDARVLVSGMGALHVPRYPDIKGTERFEGPAFHSAAWDSTVDLRGKNVAVIGTGASSIQFVPEIAPLAAKLSLFQRTAPWVVPKVDHPIADKWRSRFGRIPGLMRSFRTLLFWGLEVRVLAFLGKSKFMRAQAVKQAQEHLAAQVPDPQLRANLAPHYEFGCKRVLISNDFYPALSRPNVELVTDAIQEVRERSIVTADGVERPVHVLIYGTGFRVTDILLGIRVTGRDKEIHEAWEERVSAYLGITVAGFPNFFLLLGPNTGLGHNSVVLMIEAQVRYVMSCLRMMERRGQRVMDVRETSQRRFADSIRDRLAKTVWIAGGCRSWYQDQKTGESPVVWPGSVVAYRRQTRSASADDYQFGKVR